MKMWRLASLALGAALLPVTGAQADEKAGDAGATPANSGEKVICRTEKNTGSLTKTTRSCRTSREWADIRRQQRQQIEKMQAIGGKWDD